MAEKIAAALGCTAKDILRENAPGGAGNAAHRCARVPDRVRTGGMYRTHRAAPEDGPNRDAPGKLLTVCGRCICRPDRGVELSCRVRGADARSGRLRLCPWRGSRLCRLHTLLRIGRSRALMFWPSSASTSPSTALILRHGHCATKPASCSPGALARRCSFSLATAIVQFEGRGGGHRASHT